MSEETGTSSEEALRAASEKARRAAEEARRGAEDAAQAAASALAAGVSGAALGAGLTPSPGPAPPSVPTTPPVPTVARYYEGSCLDLPGTGAEVRFISIPWPADERAELILGAPESHRGLFFLEHSQSMHIERELLIDAILATRPDRSEGYRGKLRNVGNLPRPGDLGIDRDHLTRLRMAVEEIEPQLVRFAARVATEPLIPVEASPARGTSLADLTKGAGSTAALGYFAYGGADPVLLGTLAAGIVVVGGATGIAEGLRLGLRERIVRWLGGEPEDEDDGEAPE